jgi:hypothetical protein
MYPSARFIRQNKVAAAIVLFLCTMAAIHVGKPTILYAADGGFRPFGLGYRHKTAVPIWAASIALAILSYLAVLFYATTP